MKKKSPKTVYYSDELNDDFAGVKRKTIEIPPDFRYIREGFLWKTLSFVVYRLIMTPIAYIYKVLLGVKIVDRSAGRGRTEGCFLYGNHTLLAGDAFIPSLAVFPKKVYVVVGPENLSTKGTKNFLLMSGAVPRPQSIASFKGFNGAIERYISKGNCVSIYPEAHIWHYYTGIRPFLSTSFRYPVKLGAPVFCSTTTFEKRRFLKIPIPKITVYIDGPFYADPSLTLREAEKKLRDQVYETMCENAKKSTYSAIIYRKREETADDLDHVLGQRRDI